LLQQKSAFAENGTPSQLSDLPGEGRGLSFSTVCFSMIRFDLDVAGRELCSGSEEEVAELRTSGAEVVFVSEKI
jgi:hypothetical protein